MTSRGYTFAVTQFVTQFTHVSRHPRVSSRKQKKNSLGKTVLKMWSQKSTRTNSFVPRSRQRLLTLSFFFFAFFLHFFLKVVLWTNRPLFYKSETIFSIQVSLNIFSSSFSVSNSRMSRNMCELRHKVRNGQNLPHESLRPHYQNSLF